MLIAVSHLELEQVGKAPQNLSRQGSSQPHPPLTMILTTTILYNFLSLSLFFSHLYIYLYLRALISRKVCQMAVEIRPNASASAAQSTEVGVTTQARRGEEDSKASTSTISSGKKFFARIKDQEFAKKSWKVLTWTPKRCSWDPEDPPKFGMGLNLLFGFVSLQDIVLQVYSTHFEAWQLRGSTPNSPSRGLSKD